MARFDKMVQYNLDNPGGPERDARLPRHGYQALPLGDRVAAWARWFLGLRRACATSTGGIPADM